MNLADSVSRKQMREEGLVEALVELINVAPFEAIMVGPGSGLKVA